MLKLKPVFLAFSLLFPLQSFAKKTLTQIVNETPGSGVKNVTIAAGETAIIDGDVNVGELVINGKLSCGSASAEIKATTIYVNGTFECGSEGSPYNGKLFISLKSSNIDPFPFQGYKFRGLIVNPLGKLWLYGNKGRSGHFKLNRTANPGDVSVLVDGNVSGWKPGDVVVIASSSYNMNEAENFNVSRIEGNTVHLSWSVKKLHWGVKQPFTKQNNVIVNLDERAEIANLTRNIVIRPDESSVPVSDSGNLKDPVTGNMLPITSASGQLGGHVMVHANSSGIGEAKIDSVEFYRMGQAGIMARYPFHWHKVKNAPGQFIKNSSIWKSFQRCITVHQTNQVRVENNVCFNFKGHGYFLEDGNEVDNVITKNLGINAFRPHPHRVLLSSDNNNSGLSGTSYKRFPATSVFWISNPKNTVTYNIASGSEGVGFWNSFVGGNMFNYISDLKAFNSSSKEFDGEVLLATPPIKTNTTEFSYNVAHGTFVGHTWDGSPNQFAPGINGYQPNSINNPLNAMDRKLEISNYSPGSTPVYKGLVAFKNIHTGIYFRGDTAVFEEAVTADNGWHWFLAVNQVVRNSLIVGKSSNHSAADIAFLKTVTAQEYQVGVIMYDGPVEVDSVDFFDFATALPVNTEFDAVPFMTIGGNDKYYNLSRKVKFNKEPYHRMVMEYKEPIGTNYWLDETLTNNMRDMDGTLTGTVGGILVPDNDFTKNARCSTKNFGASASFKGFVVCPADYKVTTYWLASENTGDFTPFVMKRSDNKVSLQKSQWGELDLVGKRAGVTQLKLMLPSSEGYTYDMMLAPESIANGGGYRNMFTRMYAESANIPNPPLRIINAGFNCSLRHGKRYADLNQLNAGTEAGYYANGNDFHVKLFSRGVQQQIDATSLNSARTSDSPFDYIACEGPIKSKITGNIESVTLVNGNAVIKGWACDYGHSESIKVHVYAGGAANAGGKMIGESLASENSDALVGFGCADATMTSHRFTHVVPAAQLDIYGNQTVFVHGLSQTGGTNLTITNSGAFRLPAGVNTPKGPPGDIKGNIDSVTSNGLIKGWSCEPNTMASVKVQVYAGDPAAGGILLQEANANLASESGISSTCGTTGINHRFQVQLTDASLSKAQDKAIYVRGVALAAGKSNLTISGSGGTKIPRFDVIGYVDGVSNVSGKVYVTGWACDKGRNRQINVHFYVRGSDGSSAFAGGVLADQAAESAVAVTCQDPSSLGHRFRWEVPSSVLTAHKGKQVLGFGLSISGNNNNELPRTGSFALP